MRITKSRNICLQCQDTNLDILILGVDWWVL